ncbi:hypothetical protein [Leucobacter luti]|uniref:Uncharacterized protein n=1 Tax=Leucobacter luti TaxID=340320 RepID=A0A4Q7U209_9MICO|nr:hypothetical protein [Leucobacter luti]MBL3699229.1 hypothetical protein [Leucobacter luti]RZT66730.1 hypothetical protein EV139_0857 [Leucobacter luti]
MTDLSCGSLTYAGVSFQFGEGTPYAITNFKRGTAGYRTSDRDRVRRDGRQMGRDYKAGPSHELSLAVLGEGGTRAEREADVRSLVRALAAVWSADSLRSQSGAVAELRVGDRVARGRPRDFMPDDSGLWDGTDEPVLVFDATDDHWYGAEEATTIRFVPVFTGGLPISAEVPFVLGGGSGESSYMVTVGGDVAAWPVFELHGPIRDPFIEVVGVGRLVFTGQLAYDQTLTVNTSDGWVKRDGAAFPGALSPAGSRLSDMALRPGSYQVFFGGYDPTGSSSLDVRVAPAFTSF